MLHLAAVFLPRRLFFAVSFVSRWPPSDGCWAEDLVERNPGPFGFAAVVRTRDCLLSFQSTLAFFSLSLLDSSSFFLLLWPIKFPLPSVKRKMAPRANIHQPFHRGDWTGGVVYCCGSAESPHLREPNLAAAAAPPPFQPCSKQAGDKSGSLRSWRGETESGASFITRINHIIDLFFLLTPIVKPLQDLGLLP